MTRIDEAGMKKRAATRGDIVVEVKPGDAVLGLTDNWIVGRFVTMKNINPKEEAKVRKEVKTEQLELIKTIPVAKKTAIEKKAAPTKKPDSKTASKPKLPDSKAVAKKTAIKKTDKK
jgi:DNA-binding XRE family transcriptional regulator